MKVRVIIPAGDETNAPGAFVRNEEGGFTYKQLEKIVNMKPPKKVIDAYKKYIEPAQKKLYEHDELALKKMFGENYKQRIQELKKLIVDEEPDME